MKEYPDEVHAAINTTLSQALPYTFVDFSKLPSFEPFRRMRRLPTFLGAVVGKPLDMSSIVYDRMPPTRLPIGDLFYVTSLNVLSAYVFVIPDFRVNVFAHYMAIYRPDGEKRTMFEDARLIHQNAHINVFWSEHGAMMVNFVGRNLMFDPAYLRGGH